ncbi:putative S-layer protein [Candidatus Woesearchaeota archaeon]|nr:putative S-layer protein [Candidatus Woesearchaeota archaeon]
MSKVMKLLSALAVLIIGLLAVSGIASATIYADVELDDDYLGDGTTIIRGVERGDEFEVKVHLMSDEDLSDVQVEAYLRGYDHSDIMDDITDVFDMKANVTYVKTLTLELRERMDQDRYQLRVRVEGRNGATFYNDYDLEVEAPSHEVAIRDIIISPENEVMAGRALLTSVRIKNYGDHDEEGVRVRVSIPELGISATDYIDEIEADDSTTTEEIYLRIPSDARSGEYTVEVEVEYDDGDEETEEETSIYIVADEAASSTQPVEEKTIITIGPDVQDVQKGGAGVVYPVTITNTGSLSKAYTIEVDGADWASFRVSPSNVLVASPGESQAAYIFVSAEENAPTGENTFSVTIKSGNEVLQQAPLKANVLAGSKTTTSSADKVKKGLEVGLIVLVVLLVILGLIIGFNKLKGEEELSEEENKTYY